jgi:hypothetical protein
MKTIGQDHAGVDTMKEIEVLALTPEASTEIVRTYMANKGVLIESPELYIVS